MSGLQGATSDPANYTVGWICAIPVEHLAAVVFLDGDQHPPPTYLSPGDSNAYVLGEIGRHNVVIASLPKGEYGVSSATGVVKDMIHSFNKVRIVMMVGIGGGVPSRKHDIRLGDIVVAMPTPEGGGIYQYDFGKTIQGQTFEPTMTLNPIPHLFLTAMTPLTTKYKIDGHEIDAKIDKVLKKPSLKKEFKRPDPKTDKLYKARVVHPPKEPQCPKCGKEPQCEPCRHPPDCEDCEDELKCEKSEVDSLCGKCGNDQKNFVSRPERDAENLLTIHYGLIASGNQLMKDALVRDKLSKEKDVLCFEMEAAGLMNQFPCLVVRGICDYSDSHKNKAWQGYAAMAAAAYAKDLLNLIVPNKIEAEKKLADSFAESLGDIHSQLQEIGGSVKKWQSIQQQDSIQQWLTPPEPSIDYEGALKKRHRGSGFWVVNDFLTQWKEQQNSFRWLQGKSGSGKTILSTTIIEHLISQDKALLYFYFTFTDPAKQTFDGMIRSLVSQLSHKDPKASQLLNTLHSTCDDGRKQPESETLSNTLIQMINEVQEVWIVLDALDECDSERDVLLQWLQDVLNSDHRNVHLLVTSQPEHGIELGLKKFSKDSDTVSITNNLIAEDIRAYIRHRLSNDQNSGIVRSYQAEIEKQLVDRADGMFRWVVCQLDEVVECVDRPTLLKTLETLPKTLDETYARIIRRTPPQRQQGATRLLQFLTYSKQRLTVTEAVDAIAVTIEGDHHFDPKDRIPDPNEISRYCPSLVVQVHIGQKKINDSLWSYVPGYHNGSDTSIYNAPQIARLQLAHSSVSEYLTSDRLEKNIAQDLQEHAAKVSIATVCLAYLLHLDMRLSIEEIKRRFPFAEYSGRYWKWHGEEVEGENEKVRDLVRQLFSHPKSFRNYYKLCYPDGRLIGLHNTIAGFALICACREGLTDTVRYLLERNNTDINAGWGTLGSTALQDAAFHGHDKIVKALIEAGSNVNVVGGYDGTALQAASSRGYEQIVKYLLRAGAKVDARGGPYGTAIQAASAGGYDKVVKYLIEAGANVNITGGKYRTTLRAAFASGNDKVIEHLLNAGADTSDMDRYKWERARQKRQYH